MQKYIDFVKDTVETGMLADNPRGGSVIHKFGGQLSFDLREGFPLVGTRLTRFSSVVSELLWFIIGSTNVNTLQALGSNIWNRWADESGDIGPLYGEQWTRFVPTCNLHGRVYTSQLQYVIDCIREMPNSRRIMLSAWNPDVLPICEATLRRQGSELSPTEGIQLNISSGRQAIAPCHNQVQFYVDTAGVRKVLSGHLYMRSSDTIVGLPFNIASYALFIHLLAAHCQCDVGELFISFGDRHVYGVHLNEGYQELVSRNSPPMGTFDIQGLNLDRLFNIHESYRRSAITNDVSGITFENSANYQNDMDYLLSLKATLIESLIGYTSLGAINFTVVE